MTHRLRIARIAAHLYNALAEAVQALPESTQRKLSPIMLGVAIRVADEQVDARREDVMRTAAVTDPSWN